MMDKAGLALALVIGSTLPLWAGEDARPVPRIHGRDGDSRQAFQWQPGDLTLTQGAKPGVSSRTIVGAAGEPGLYLIRVHMDPHAVIPAHVHPDARVTTVLSGTVYYGLGSVADREDAKAYGAGSAYFTPANTPHFLIAGDGPALYEEVGFGPTRSDPVAKRTP